MNCILKSTALSKKYINKVALKSVDLEIPTGKIIGLLGPNGSGKTTFLKIVAGILKQSSGEILIDGKKPGVETKSIVAYLPDKDFLYKWMKIKDSFDYYEDFYKDFDREKANRLLDFMGLDEKSKISSLSKGMHEKLYIVLTLARRAKLYILDEPLGGVDPIAREKILDAILENYSEDSSMIVTTHLVSDIERLFDDVAFISNGEIILQGNAETLRTEKNMSIDELYREVFKNV